MMELLHITMSASQIRDACKAFAQTRSSITEPCTVSVSFVFGESREAGVPGEIRAEVVFSKKRVRTSNAISPTEKGSAS